MSHAEHDVVKRAIEHLDRGEDAEALALLGPYVVRNPDDTEALFRLGVAYARAGRIHDATRVFSRVVEREPEHGRALWSLGRILLLLENPAAAEPLLRMALRHAPEQSDLWTDHAIALEGVGRPREARQALADACRRFPDDVYLKARLLAFETREGDRAAAAGTVDRFEALHADDPVANAAIVNYCLDPPDPDRARRAAARFWRDRVGSILDYEELLREVAEAFPPGERALVRGRDESRTCPACGATERCRDIVGLVMGTDPLERMAVLGTWVTETICACGLQLPRPRRVEVLFPEISIAFRVDEFPHDETNVADVASIRPGDFGESAAAAPKAEVWFAIGVSGSGALSLALESEAVAASREDSLPEIGELGRAERRARETVTALRMAAGVDEGEDDERPPLPEWLRIEREGLLTSGIAARPWPLDHRCACGADLRPFLFGRERGRRYDPAAVDEAAISGRPFVDPESEESVLGFNCDACGRLHTWILGILPRSETDRP